MHPLRCLAIAQRSTTLRVHTSPSQCPTGRSSTPPLPRITLPCLGPALPHAVANCPTLPRLCLYTATRYAASLYAAKPCLCRAQRNLAYASPSFAMPVPRKSRQCHGRALRCFSFQYITRPLQIITILRKTIAYAVFRRARPSLHYASPSLLHTVPMRHAAMQKPLPHIAVLNRTGATHCFAMRNRRSTPPYLPSTELYRTALRISMAAPSDSEPTLGSSPP